MCRGGEGASDPTRRSAQTQALSAHLLHVKWRKTKWGPRWLQIVVYLYVATFSGFYIGVMAAAKPQPREAAATQSLPVSDVGWV
jgi:hypothetical protein